MVFPTTNLPIAAQVEINGTWVDVPWRGDGVNGASITRGRADESARVSWSRCTLAIDNTSGDWYNRNPNSQYYGLLGRNTPFRILVTSDSTPTVRAVSSTASNGSEITLSAPTGTSAGDLLLVFQTSDAAFVHELTGPGDGWLPVSVVATTSGDLGQLVTRVWRRWATGAETSWTLAQGSASDGVAAAVAIMSAGYGHVQVTYDDTAHTSGTSYVAPTAVSISDDDLDLRWIGASDETGISSVSWTPPGTHTELVDTQSNTFTTATLARRTLSAQGDVGTATFTATTSSLDWSHGITVLVSADCPRHYGEIPSWAPVWNLAGVDVTVPIESSGIMRRLDTGAPPLRSALYRALLSSTPNAWWPLESGDGRAATLAPSGVPGGRPMAAEPASAGTHRLSGVVGGDTVGPPGADGAIDTSGGGQLRAAISPVTSSTWRFEMGYLFTDPVGEFDSGQMVRIKFGDAIVGVYAGAAASSETTIQFTDGVDFHSDATTDVTDDGAWHHMRLDLTSSGSDTDYELAIDGTVIMSDTAPDIAFASPSEVVLSPTGDVDAVSHAVMWIGSNVPTSDTYGYDAFTGHAGETAAARLTRLCDEEGVLFELVGLGADTAAVGSQQVDTLLNLMFAAAKVDQGILFEPRHFLGLSYRTRSSLYNQQPIVGLDYAGGQVAPPLRPVEDDQQLVNRVTVTRVGGGSRIVEKNSGPLSSAAPPAGVGTYESGVQVNVQADDQLDDVGGVVVHLGTWDEARYPQVTVWLHAPDLADDRVLTVQAISGDLGDRMTITNPPAWLPPDDIDLLIEGQTETLASRWWEIVTNATPYGPWRAGQVEADSRVASGGEHTLTADLSAVAVSFQVASSTDALWSTDAADFPLGIIIGGERITLSTISGSSSPQTFTVSARSVNGIMKAHSSGDEVEVFDPAYVAR